MPRTLSRRALFLGRRSEPDPAVPVRPDHSRLVAELAANCLAVNGVTCSVCADPCEPRALRIRPLVGGRALPVIDSESCTGCGECVQVCPVGALAVVEKSGVPEDARCA